MGNIRPSFIKIRAIRLWSFIPINLPIVSMTTRDLLANIQTWEVRE